MPLINKQPNAFLNFCPIGLPLVQSWWQYGARFGEPKFEIICTKDMYVNLILLSRFFFGNIANCFGSLSFVAEK